MKKSHLQPSQSIEFLGIMVDTLAMELKLPGENIEKDLCRGRSVFEGGVNHSEGSFSAARQDECSHTGDTSSSSILLPFTNEFVSGTRLLLLEL